MNLKKRSTTKITKATKRPWRTIGHRAPTTDSSGYARIRA